MYDVIDCVTRRVIGTYKSRKRAANKADALDMAYGAVRYVVVFSGTTQFASRFGA